MPTILVRDFDLGATLDSGQVFGFTRSERGEYAGSVRGVWMELRQKGATLQARTPHPRAKALLVDYFDLARDLEPVYKVLREDACLRPAYERLRGLRLIRQDAWEALACFILSSNNNVKRIQLIWKNLSEYFHAFPKPSQIAQSHERILRGLGLGYRAPFLLGTARFLASNPDWLETVREAEYEEARSRVSSFPGIGPKVADCVLLYGFGRLEAFPVDVWILRIVRKLYFKGRRVSEDRVRRFGQERWGAQAGYVQQYLFHGARTGVI